MKKIFAAACILLFAACKQPTQNVASQQGTTQQAPAQLLPGHGSDSADLTTFMELSDFHIFKLELPQSLSGDSLNIHFREFYKGVRIDSFTLGGELTFYKSRWLRCYGRKKNDTLAQLFVTDQVLPFELDYALASKTTGRYRWTELYNTHKPTDYQARVEIPFLFYGTVPMEDGKCVYCQLPEASAQYGDWYRQFSVEHYWIISLSIYPTQDNTP